MSIVHQDSLLDGKICTKCGVWKTFQHYRPRSESPYYMAACKECEAARIRERRHSGTYTPVPLPPERKRRPRREDVDYAGYLARKRRNVRAYHQRHPVRVRGLALASVHRRRAKIAGVDGSFTPQEWKDLCALYGNRCLACGEGKSLTVDHVVPLSMGGANTIDNIQCLCRSCNSKKHDKAIDYRPPT